MIEISTLVEGDVVQNKGSRRRWLVVKANSDGAVVVNEVYLTWAPEWNIVHPSDEGTRDRVETFKRAIV